MNVPEIAAIAHRNGLPLLVDATFTTPYLCQPIALGADLVMHSATKFLSGHGVVIGGLLVDGGTFDWEASGRFATLTEPYAGFHDLVFAEEFGPAAFITRARREGIRDFGACMAPMTAFQVLQGLETLTAAEWTVTWRTPGPSSVFWLSIRWSRRWDIRSSRIIPITSWPGKSCQRARVRSSVSNSSAVGKPGRLSSNRSRLFSHLANVGDAKSLVIHPASTTHHRMDAEALAAAGIGAGLIRLSIGLEDPGDLIGDLKKGLRAVEKLAGKKP